MQIRIRWLTHGHFDGGNPQAPNIRLVIVARLLDHLG